jgi:enamine deaminase RidA (YjgF/YER057c/UK114 family)
MQKEIISTNKAPKAIGTYSQAVKVSDTVYLSGQIPLIPETMEMVTGDRVTITPYTIHRMEGIEDSEYLECSTP